MDQRGEDRAELECLECVRAESARLEKREAGEAEKQGVG